MSLIAAVRSDSSSDVLTSLRAVCDSQGLGDLSAHLADLADLVKWDMAALEEGIQSLPCGRQRGPRECPPFARDSGQAAPSNVRGLGFTAGRWSRRQHP